MPNPISSTPNSQYQAPVDHAETQAVGPKEVSCAAPAAAVATAGVAMAQSVSALVAGAPTLIGALPGALGFVVASMGMGIAAANYANCRDEQAAKAK
jgi:hypothetical protein